MSLSIFKEMTLHTVFGADVDEYRLLKIACKMSDVLGSFTCFQHKYKIYILCKHT